jgi:hypothetical protein
MAVLQTSQRSKPQGDSVCRYARRLYASEPMGVDLDQSLYALDSTTIDLCLSLFPWAKFRKHKAAVKMHTLLDLRGNIPTFIRITDGKVHDVNILDEIMPEAGAFYVMDRGYIDFERLFMLTLSSAFFVVRTKSNVLLQRRYSHPVDKSTGIRSDQTVILSSFESASAYPDPLRRVSYFDAETGKRFQAPLKPSSLLCCHPSALASASAPSRASEHSFSLYSGVGQRDAPRAALTC